MKIKEGKQIGFVIKKGINVDKQFQYGKCIFEQGFDSANVGVSEVTLNGTIGKNLKSYTIKGNIVQNGTPAPDNPIEVLGVGDRTGNLFDSSTATLGKYINSEGIETASSSHSAIERLNHSNFFEVVPNGSYTLSSVKSSSVRQTVAFCWYDATKTFLSRTTEQKDTGTIDYSITGIAPADARFAVINYTTANNKVMLNEGSTALPYEPYGYKIPVTTIGKNLFDESTIEVGGIDQSTGEETENSSRRRSGFIPCTPSTTYTISRSMKTTTSYFWVLKYRSDKTYIGVVTSVGASTMFTTGTETFYLRWYVTQPRDYSNVMLNLGSTALPYEPYREPVVSNVYLDEPLYSGDYIKLNTDGSGVVHREWEKLALTGAENWNTWTYTGAVNSFFFTNIKKTNALSDRYSQGDVLKILSTDGIMYVTTASTIIRDDRFTTVESFKAYLAAQYAAGTPVTVYYRLKAPTDTPIVLPDIPTLKALPPLHTYDGATTVISVDTTVSPSKFDAAYKSNVSNPYKIEYHTADNIGFASADGAVFTTRY